jgi:hypothetical protein
MVGKLFRDIFISFTFVVIFFGASSLFKERRDPKEDCGKKIIQRVSRSFLQSLYRAIKNNDRKEVVKIISILEKTNHVRMNFNGLSGLPLQEARSQLRNLKAVARNPEVRANAVKMLRNSPYAMDSALKSRIENIRDPLEENAHPNGDFVCLARTNSAFFDAEEYECDGEEDFVLGAFRLSAVEADEETAEVLSGEFSTHCTSSRFFNRWENFLQKFRQQL